MVIFKTASYVHWKVLKHSFYFVLLKNHATFIYRLVLTFIVCSMKTLLVDRF